MVQRPLSYSKTNTMSIANSVKTQMKDIFEEYDPHCQVIKIKEEKISKLFSIHYHTDWAFDYAETCGSFPIFHILSQPEYAYRVTMITVTGEDEGVNGTQDWNIKSLLDNDAIFDNLETVIFPLNDTENHHRRLLTYDDSYDENNGLGLLLNKCPNLKKLVSPSAPGPLFFDRKEHGLTELVLQSGYDNQNFIASLSRSDCFTSLSTLSFRDFAEVQQKENFDESLTKFDDYLALMNATGLPALKEITLIDTKLKDNEKELLTEAAKKNGRKLIFTKLGNKYDDFF